MFARATTAYAALPVAVRNACSTGVREAVEFIRSRRNAYEPSSSRTKYESVLQSARLVQQFEQMTGATAQGSAGMRDAFMAENAIWVLQQAGPSARMMLWAHNLHVVRATNAMGDSLGRAYGSSYLNLAFLFGRGSFNAFGSSGQTAGSLKPWQAQFVPQQSLEAVFLLAEQPLLLFDARTIAAGGAAAAPLRGPIAMRSIGASYDASRESTYFTMHTLPHDYDLLLFVKETTPSVLLPFVR